jgi:hypothetical protein
MHSIVTPLQIAMAFLRHFQMPMLPLQHANYATCSPFCQGCTVIIKLDFDDLTIAYLKVCLTKVSALHTTQTLLMQLVLNTSSL